MTGSPFNHWDKGEYVEETQPLSYKQALAALPNADFHYTRDKNGETWTYDQCQPVKDEPQTFLQFNKYRIWISFVVGGLMVSHHLDGWLYYAAVFLLAIAMWSLIDAVANQKKGRK